MAVERIYSSAKEPRPTLRTAARGTRQHVGYMIAGVLRASELKELTARKGTAYLCQVF